MSTTLTPRVIRLACIKDEHTPGKDLLTGNPPIIWRGTDVLIQLGFFVGTTLIDSKANLANVYLEIHASRNSPALVQKVVAGADLDVTVTADQWSNKTHQHVAISLTAAETQFDLANVNENRRDFWLVVHVVDIDGKRFTVGCANLTVEEDAAQNDLQVVPLSDPAFRVSNGWLELWNPDQQKYCPIYVRGAAGQEQIVPAGGVS